MSRPGTASPAGGGAAEVVRELARRFAAGDRDGARALFHPNIRIEQPPSLPHGGVHHGLDGMDAMGAAFARHWDRAVRDPRVLGCEAPGGGDPGSGDQDDSATVIQVTTQTWTSRATGRSATVDVIELLTVEEGRVTDIRVFPQDTHLLLATLPGRPEQAG